MSETMKEILDEVWRSVSLEESNLQLVVSYWAKREEIEKLLGSDKKRDMSSVWELAVRASKVSNSYSAFLQRLTRVDPPDGYRKLLMDFRAKTRIVVGSGPTGWEVSMVQLLAPYSVPWIPGSSLKGAIESAALQEIDTSTPIEDRLVDSSKAAFLRNGEKLAIWKYKNLNLADLRGQLKPIARLFGTKKYRGELIVIGGFLKSAPEEGHLTIDVVTPHYKTYYERKGEIPPNEFTEPVPVKFPAVREGTVFTFILMTPEEYENFTRKILTRTLTEFGVGGKTVAGYGLFEGPL